MEFVQNLLDIIIQYSGYILGFFSYLLESAKGLLSGGNVLLFVLFLLIVWKVVMKLKG